MNNNLNNYLFALAERMLLRKGYRSKRWADFKPEYRITGLEVPCVKNSIDYDAKVINALLQKFSITVNKKQSYILIKIL